MRCPLISAAVLSLSLVFTGAASAAEWVPRAMGNRVVGEVDVWPHFWRHNVAMVVAAQIQIDEAVFLDLDMTGVVTTPGPEANEYVQPTFAFGNPTIGVHWANRLSDKLAMHAGSTVAVATLVNAPLDNSDDASSTRYLGAAARGYADLHRFFDDYIFLRARTGVELRFLPALYYRAELTSMIAIPTAKALNDVEYIVDIHNEIEARHSSGVGCGLHFQAVFNTHQDLYVTYNDTAQLAVEPYLFYDPGRGFYARLGSLVAIDEPLGFGFDKGGLASIHVTLGGRW